MPAAEAWRTVFRVVVGLFWLYYASQKLGGIAWMRGPIQASAQANPIPGLHEFLVVVVSPNWFWFALAQTIGETAAGVLLVLGLATRRAAVLGTLLALNLALTVAFLAPHLDGRWLYYLAVLANVELIVTEPGPLALENARFVPAWLRG